MKAVHRPDLGRLLILIALLIVYGSVFPGPLIWRAVNPLAVLLNSWPKHMEAAAYLDAAENLLLYFPLGAIAALCYPRRPIESALGLGLSLALAVELVQVYLPYRVSSTADILCNGAGALAGGLAAVRLRRHLLEITRRVCSIAASEGLLLIILWISYQLFPFIPHFSPNSLRAEFAILQNPGDILPAEIFADTAEWFAAALTLESVFGRMTPGWWAALAILRIALRPFLLTRMFALEDLLGLALALALWVILPVSLRLRAALAMLSVAIASRSLAPFRYSELQAVFGGAGVMFRKGFDYGAAIWMLHRVGLSYVRAGALLAAILLGFLVMQAVLRHELSPADPLLAAAAAFGLWRLAPLVWRN